MAQWIHLAQGRQHEKAAEHLRWARVLVTRISACLSSLLRVFKRKYAFEDFAIRQVALLSKKTADEAKYANRSLVRAPFLVL